MVDHHESKVIRNLLIALLALVFVFITGTVGYRILGGPQYSWLDCFYMTFITTATIGYSEVIDVTHYEYGRLFTVFIGMAGIGVLGYVLSTLTAFMLENDLNISRRKRKMKLKIEQLKNHYIVCGVGLVGSNVAHDLELTGRPSVIIDNDLENIHRYLEMHPTQLYLHGDATDNDVLLAAGITNAKGVFAVAHDDSANLVISLSSKQLNPKLRVVARCHAPKNAEKTRRAGADEVISPDFSGGLRIVSAMVRPNVMNFLDEMLKSDSKLRMEEIVIPDSLANKPLSVLYHSNKDCMVLALQRDETWQFNPQASHHLQDKDVLMVMATPEGRSRLEQLIQGID
ncbi:potassium channel protein [Sideroxydans sp. CL21]|uniref:potassium channel family protein n=1 Tax=Sideroxydans sp. CL21 TaxID=2600596 RepID=UPI0024BBEDC9|nr:potassium channel protein [Sideroxydans sp. CL21]